MTGNEKDEVQNVKVYFIESGFRAGPVALVQAQVSRRSSCWRLRAFRALPWMAVVQV